MAPASPSATKSKRRRPPTDGCFPSVIPSPRGTWSRSGGAKEMSLALRRFRCSVAHALLRAASTLVSTLCGAANPGCRRLSAGACRVRGFAPGPEKPPERRLQARLPAPQALILERKAVTHSNDSMTRRGLLGRALGTAALISALDSAKQLAGQTPEAATRARDSFDFGWKFLKGDAAGAQQPGFADTNWRSLDLPHDWRDRK